MTVWAFIDESGDPDLKVDAGASSHFAVSAVVVPDRELVVVRERVEQLRKKYFQTGQIKSKSVGANVERRKVVLSALIATGIRFIGLVVDKRRLDRSSGLRFRSSFMKFIDRFVYDRLFRAYPALNVRADRHGRQQFMDSFKSYLARRAAQTDLFEHPPEIEFAKSDDEVMIQAADLVAGSLRVAHDDQIGDADARSILASLRPASLGIQAWPAVARTTAALPAVEDADGADEHVRRAAERSAYAFLADAQGQGDDPTRMQIEVLQELLYAFRAEELPFVSSDALAERLRALGYADCSRDTIRRSVIAPMRDREVLIVSSAKGYGLPSKLAHVDTHVERMDEEVRPILRRVEVMDSLLKRATMGKIGLLERERFSVLRELVMRHGELSRQASSRSEGAQ